MIDKALLAKIRKCLALARSANEHEAAAALAKARQLMEEHGVIALPAGANVLRLLPPLIITEDEIAFAVDAIAAVLPA